MGSGSPLAIEMCKAVWLLRGAKDGERLNMVAHGSVIMWRTDSLCRLPHIHIGDVAEGRYDRKIGCASKSIKLLLFNGKF